MLELRAIRAEILKELDKAKPRFEDYKSAKDKFDENPLHDKLKKVQAEIDKLIDEI